MSLTLYTPDGNMIVAEDGPPYQYTPEGFNTFLSTNSVPLSMWDGRGGSYARIYETQPWVAAVIHKLVRQVARLPLKVYERDSQGEKKRVMGGPLFELVTEPAPRCGPTQLKQWMAFPLFLHGNGGLEKVRNNRGGVPVGLKPVDWRNLDPRFASNHDQQFVDHWLDVTEPGNRRVIQPDDLLHVAWYSAFGQLGISPLYHLGVSLRIEVAAQLYQEGLFRNSARPSGAIKTPNGVVLDKELRDEIRRDLNQVYGGPTNAGKPILLPNGLEWQPTSWNAGEAELIAQRELTREEIAGVYDIPPPLIGQLKRATFSNIVELHRMLYTTVLGAHLVLLEESFKAQVIDDEPAFEGQWVEFDLKEVLRGDPLQEAQALATDITSGILTINEARAILNLPRIDHDDADRPMIPTNNMGFIGGTPDPSDTPDLPEDDDTEELDDGEDLGSSTAKAIAKLASVSPSFAQAITKLALDGVSVNGHG